MPAGVSPAGLALALLFVRFADEWFTFFPAGALSDIRAELSLSYTQAGVLLAALPAGGILGNLFTVAADFWSRRLLAALGAAAYGVCLAAFAAGETFWLLLAASFLWGTASDAFVHGCEVALVDLARERLAPALARVNALGAVGDVLGPATLAAVAAVGLGWRAAFALGAALMLLYAGWLAAYAFPPPSPPKEARTPLSSVLAVARDRRVQVLAVAEALFSVLDEPLIGFTIVYLETHRGLSETAATLIAGVTVAGGIGGYVLAEWLSVRARARPLLLGSCTVLAVSVTGLIVPPWWAAVVAAGVMFGVSGAVFYSVLQATYLGLRPGQAGATQTIVGTIGLAGLAFPPLVGWVADRWTLTAGMALYAAVPLAVLALLLAAPRAVPDELPEAPMDGE